MGSKPKGKGLFIPWIVFLLIGCGSGGPPLTQQQQWEQDIEHLAAQSAAIHPNLFHLITSGEYFTAVDNLVSNTPNLTTNQIFVEIKKLVAMPAMEEDGHTGVTMFQATGFRLYPLRMYEFSDGLYVIDANAPYEDAIGKRVVQIGGMDIDQVNQILDPLITRDNDTTVILKRTLHYVVPEVLQALGIISDAEQGDYLLENENGDLTTLLVTPVDKQVYKDTIESTVGMPNPSAFLFLSNPSEAFWMQEISTSNALYIKYNFVGATTQSGLTLTQFSAQIASTVASSGIQKVIVDVRHNGGGDNSTFAPLLAVLSGSAINQPGMLYALIDRVTFSAAANFVTDLDLNTSAIFAGEPTGGSPNNYGDTVGINLPNSGYSVFIPTRFWEFSPGDQRLAIAPDIPVSFTAADYFNFFDPVLDTVLNE